MSGRFHIVGSEDALGEVVKLCENGEQIQDKVKGAVMDAKSERVSLKYLLENLANVLESVVREHRTIEVETPSGGVVVVAPKNVGISHLATRTAEDYEAFCTAAGSWGDEDIDTLLQHLYESRQSSSRPAVEL